VKKSLKLSIGKRNWGFLVQGGWFPGFAGGLRAVCLVRPYSALCLTQ
jgi:hypothetical protein